MCMYFESIDVITINTTKMNINIPCHADVSVIKIVMKVAMRAKNTTCFTNIFIVCGRTDLRSSIDKLDVPAMERLLLF